MQTVTKSALTQALAAAAAGALLALGIDAIATGQERDPPAIQQPKAKRSAAAVRAFKAQHPCPATGKAGGACPGYVVDHIEPLCAGGADAPANMQWQRTADAKTKDRAEQAQCRALRKGAK